MGTARSHERTLLVLLTSFGVSLVAASHGLRHWVEHGGALMATRSVRPASAVEPAPAPRGIRPPWREPLVPEMRRRKGRPQRRMTADVARPAMHERPLQRMPSHSASAQGRSATSRPSRQTVRTWLTPA
jgi:hypothetical protein